MIALRRPRAAAVQAFLATQRGLAFPYAPVGATRTETLVPGFDNDRRQVRLGDGEAVFDAACDALRRWAMFPGGWVWIEPADAPIVAGQTVAMIARVFGMYWVNAARIVYVIDEPRRFGFAYGALPGHAECGEERFLIERLVDGSVWYDLRAFSRPRHPLVRLGYPLARRLQGRFARESLAALTGL